MADLRLITGYPAALEQALADDLREARAADPLAPVTVLVGGTLLRPHLRRRLAEIAGGHLGVRLLTPAELGLALGEQSLVARGLSPLPPLAERILARQVAEAAPDYFTPVGPTPGFATALRRLFRELGEAGVDSERFGRAASGRRKQRELAGLFARYGTLRSGFYGAADALAAADPARFDATRLLVHGLWDPAAELRRVLAELSVRVPVHVYLPRLGGVADAPHARFRHWLGRLGAVEDEARASEADPAPGPRSLEHLRRGLFSREGHGPEDPGTTGPESAGTPGPEAAGTPGPEDPSVRLVSAPDPGREVRAAARACLRWAREGIAFHDMALVYRQEDPYRALAEGVFGEAGIPVYLHQGSPLSERPLGRRAAALLELVDSPLERSAVMRFLTDARLPDETFHRYGGLPASTWDSISRRAGIVEGRDQWLERLARHRRLVEASDGDDPFDRLGAIDRLIAFIEDLDARLRARPGRASWSVHTAYAGGLLGHYLDDAEPLLEALAPLGALDAVAGEVTFDRFREVVLDTIGTLRSADVLNARPGAYAQRGVNVLDANSARGLGFRAVAVVGLTERSFPPPPRQDPLLLDDERTALNTEHGFELPLRALGPDPEPLQFALAVHAARERLQLSYARTEDGGARPQLPSGFFLAAAETLTGAEIAAEEVDELPAPLFERLPAGRLGAPVLAHALTAQEYDRTLIESTPALGAAALVARAPVVGRAIAAYRARHEDERLTAYDGVLGPGARQALAERAGLTGPLSPSSLETYATCPYRFFLDRVLRLKPVEDPERLDRLDPMEKGTLVHRVLERFLTERGRDRDPPRAERTEAHLARLMAIAQEECADRERRGLTGRGLLWRLDRRQIMDELRSWYEHELEDEEMLALEKGAFEVCFGPPREGEAVGDEVEEAGDEGEETDELSTDEPLEVDAGGARLRFKGRIDRVNWGGQPASFRVTDYKTGRLRKDHADDQLSGGRALQLPIYLLAAAGILGLPPESGEAHYYYASRRGGFERVRFRGATLAEREQELHRVLRTMAESIAEGDFHALPDAWSKCRWCDYDSVCPAQRERIAERKSRDPRAVRIAELSEIE